MLTRRYVLDTNIVFYEMRSEDKALLSKMEAFLAGELVICVITLDELEQKLAPGRRR